MIETQNSSRHELPAGLIHDIRTPLGQIIGYSEILMEQAQEKGQDAFVPDLQKVRVAGLQLLALIDDNISPTQAPFEAVPPKLVIPETPLESLEAAPVGESQSLLLVVDDSESNRDVLTRRLRSQGHSVVTAENGARALAMLSAATCDLILLDIMMPGMDGYEVLRRLKADARLQHIPVIMISALSEVESVVRCIEMGAEDYLPKPFNHVILKARVTACLEKKAAHDREVRLHEELEANYARLQALERVRDDMTHMIVHDLRTPLTSVIAGIHSLKTTGELNRTQQEMAEIAVEGSETLLSMINDLLDVEKAETADMEIESELLSVEELIRSVASQMGSLAAEKEISLVQEVEKGLPAISGDEDKLRRILVNLVGNAVKFTPAKGTVSIAASLYGDSVLFAVSDTGEGIPESEFLHIFEKFGQAESRQSGRTTGSGLGLTFCKLAVEAHGGQIMVASKVGEGSTFSFTIPHS